MARAYGIAPYGAERLQDLGRQRKRTSTKSFDFSEVSKDVGCRDISPSCLICPLPQCIFDIPSPERAAYRARFLSNKGHK
jgi:hypothetical protein